MTCAQVWGRLTPGVWALSKWAFSDVVERTVIIQTDGFMSSQPSVKTFESLSILFMDIYRGSVDHREGVVYFLLKHCHQGSHAERIPVRHMTQQRTSSSRASEAVMPSVREYFAKQRGRGKVPSHNLSTRLLRLSSLLASDILVKLVREHSAASSAVLTSLMNRISAFMNLQVTSQLPGAARRSMLLPPPLVLHRSAPSSTMTPHLTAYSVD
jgi:hypothetical protein